MDTFKTFDSTVISLIILIILYFNMYSRSQKVFTSYVLYRSLVLTNIIMLIVDFLCWYFNTLPGNFNLWGNRIANYLLYVLAPVAPLLWILYTNYQIYNDSKRLKKLSLFLIFPLAVNLIFTTVNLKTGWFYWIDEANVYYRGEYLGTLVIMSFIILGFSFVSIVRNRSIIEKQHFISLLLFFVPPVVGITIQYFNYGVNYNWSGMMVALLIIYFNIQDRSLKTVYLTGVFNRRQLDNYLRYKIQTSSERKSFSAILIDITKFKQINDLYGHQIGDEALQESVKILKKCIAKDDFIARYGGDEFFLILDISDSAELAKIVKCIQQEIELFNSEKKKPYQLKFDMGYTVYDWHQKMQAEDFYRYIDKLMYENKNVKE